MTVAAVLVLLGSAPSPAAALGLLRDPGAAEDPFGPVVAGISLAAWVIALWLALTVLVTLAASRTGRTARLSRAAATLIAPAAVRRAVELSLGLTVAVVVVGVPSASAAEPFSHAATAVAGATATAPATTWALDWPTSPPAAAPGSSPATGPAPSAPGPPAASTTPPPGAPTGAPPTTGAAPATASGASVVVRPGDSLWRLAQAHLVATGEEASPRAVATAWPSWWAANRDRVGDDPGLLHPGTELTVPGGDR